MAGSLDACAYAYMRMRTLLHGVGLDAACASSQPGNRPSKEMRLSTSHPCHSRPHLRRRHSQSSRSGTDGRGCDVGRPWEPICGASSATHTRNGPCIRTAHRAAHDAGGGWAYLCLRRRCGHGLVVLVLILVFLLLLRWRRTVAGTCRVSVCTHERCSVCAKWRKGSIFARLRWRAYRVRRILVRVELLLSLAQKGRQLLHLALCVALEFCNNQARNRRDQSPTRACTAPNLNRLAMMAI